MAVTGYTAYATSGDFAGTGTEKIKRELLMTFVNVNPWGSSYSATPTWELQGAGVEDSSIEFDIDSETVTDILGHSETTVNAITKRQTLDMTVRRGNKLHLKLIRDIEDNAKEKFNGYDVMIVRKYLTENVGGTTGVYTVTVSTALSSGDKVTITAGSSGAKQYEYSSGATTKSAQATAIAALFASDTVFTVTTDDDKVIFTQKVNGTGAVPTVDNTASSTGALSVATTTAGAAGTEEYHAEVHKNSSVVPQSEGGSSYVDMPVEITLSDDRTQGTVTFSGSTPTFAAFSSGT